jgi:hypothetical protein
VKYCPTCSQTYGDETATFCSKDATPLVDELSSSQLSDTMFPGQPKNTAPTPALQGISSQSSDSVTPSSQVLPVEMDTMSSSKSRNDGSQSPVSAGASDQQSAGPIRLVFDLSEAASPAAKAKPKSQPILPPKPLAKLQSKTPPKSSLKSRPVRKRRLLVLGVGIVGVGLILGAAGIFFWWQHYKTTPAYSLALLVDAVHRNDTAKFDQIVSADKIADTSASQLKQNVLSQYSSEVNDSFRKQIESKLNGLSANVKQMVREDVEKQIKEEAAPSAGKSFLMVALALPYKVGIRQAGDSATVDTKGHPAELTMQRSNGEPWTVIAVKDGTMESRILSQIRKELPTSGEEKKLSAAARKKNQAMAAEQKNSTEGAAAKNTEGAPAKKTEGAPAKTTEGAPAKKTAGAPAKKRARKTQREGIRIEIRPIPWPE